MRNLTLSLLSILFMACCGSCVQQDKRTSTESFSSSPTAGCWSAAPAPA
jgi:hypothetical protein